MEEARYAIAKTSKDCGHKIPFNLVKQHTSNRGLTVGCVECSKARLVYTAKKLTESENKSFNCVMSEMMNNCGSTLA